MKRVFILVLDSLGIGSTKDAIFFDDVGSNTLGHIASFCYFNRKIGLKKQKLYIPNLLSLGLGHAYQKLHHVFPLGLEYNSKNLIGSYGYAEEQSSGKDTTSGHWEIAGVPVLFKWDYFKNKKESFPKNLLKTILLKTDIKGFLGNCHASGTDILNDFGIQHIQSLYPIFYTSGDSVFQVACHEKVFGLNKLYTLCKIIRDILNKSQYMVARVIARPFSGFQKNNFFRTNYRKDFSIPPIQSTVMNKLIEEKKGIVTAIGKTFDIFSGCGITNKIEAYGLLNLINATITEIHNAKNNSIIFTNFVDFDSVWGHRRDILGYADGLEYFDRHLTRILKILKKNDLLIITADHGCDPSWKGTDHTREHIPILLYQKNMNVNFLGFRRTFSDIAQTISNYFVLSKMTFGQSML
ncbi:phosphopentomutase [Buchnera aphidicola (Thelaxes californica)]|uniref:Phosphopentomutase n=1 Tax=Buchnera aphidicola (Thelaxes californica) TaxID=1315998 RepID=A0A4D6YJZ1_9GAMM|nr:phosphopentomutase [Buchnera aphidicola]QCI26941.1 phosphopentomutase [Buchnera aphidicola (Thelaxes californica)]